jgi:tRNA (Thr-GGU) A37 N-methylase
MPGEHNDAEKLAVLLGYWIEHNREHITENRAWAKKAEKAGLSGAADHLKRAVELSEEVNRNMEHAREGVEAALDKAAHTHAEHGRDTGGREHVHSAETPAGHLHPAEPRRGVHGDHVHPTEPASGHRHAHRHIELHQIGEIRTPHRDRLPRELPGEAGDGPYGIHLNEELLEALENLQGCSRIYVLFHRGGSEQPPGRSGKPGAPFGRLGQVGLSVVSVLGVSGNVISISPVGVPDGTPVLALLPCLEGGD